MWFQLLKQNSDNYTKIPASYVIFLVILSFAMKLRYMSGKFVLKDMPFGCSFAGTCYGDNLTERCAPVLCGYLE
jgi:hypothetical protein